MARFRKLVEVVTIHARRIGTREDFAAVLDEWSQEDGESFLMMLRQMPYVIRGLFQSVAKSARQDFPHPPGGRPAALSPEQRREVV